MQLLMRYKAIFSATIAGVTIVSKERLKIRIKNKSLSQMMKTHKPRNFCRVDNKYFFK